MTTTTAAFSKCPHKWKPVSSIMMTSSSSTWNQLRFIWKTCFAPYFQQHRKTYLYYLVLVCIIYFLANLVIPQCLAPLMELKMEECTWSCFSKRLGILIGVNGLWGILNYFRVQWESNVPLDHQKWIRQHLFSNVIDTFQAKKEAVAVGMFLSRYQVIPREIRYVFENAVAVFPIFIVMTYLVLFFVWLCPWIGFIYFLMCLGMIWYALFSSQQKICQYWILQRARLSLSVQDDISQEIQNLEHVYANQKESQRLDVQSQKEECLCDVSQTAQKHVDKLMMHLRITNILTFFIMSLLFFSRFQQHQRQPSIIPPLRSSWTSIILTLLLAEGSMYYSLSRVVNLFHGISMVTTYYHAMKVTTPTFTSSTSKTEMKKEWPLQDLILSLNHVSFQYPSLSKQTISRLHGRFSKGHCILVEGPSGSGKSTFFSLLYGTISPTEGEIFVGPWSSKNVPLQEWRQWFVISPQRTELYHDSLAYNIFLESYDQVEVSKKDYVHHLIDKYQWNRILGDDLQRSCGTVGNDVSLGMTKLVLFLRLLVRLFVLQKQGMYSIVLLDEPLASLDKTTQLSVLSAIRTEITCPQRIVFVSNHVPLDLSDKQWFSHILTSQTWEIQSNTSHHHSI